MDQNRSAGVRLEVAILAADQAAPATASDAANDELARLTVLVVAAETDVRWHVRECLRDRADVRVLEAASVAAALTLEVQAAPHVLVIDAPMSEMLVALPLARALVIVDSEPRREQAADARVRFLARPFTADQLVTAVSNRARVVGLARVQPSNLFAGSSVQYLSATDIEARWVATRPSSSRSLRSTSRS